MTVVLTVAHVQHFLAGPTLYSLQIQLPISHLLQSNYRCRTSTRPWSLFFPPKSPATTSVVASAPSVSTRRTIPHSPVLNIHTPSQEQFPHNPIHHLELSKARMMQSTSSAILSPPSADEKGTGNTRHDLSSRPFPAELLPLSCVSEKRPSDRSSPIPIARSSCCHSGTLRSPAPIHYPPQSREPCEDAGCLGGGWFSNLSPRARVWLSFGAWGATSIGFILAIAFWKKEVFTGLDNLSHWLATGGYKGYAIIFFLIFVTTIREW